MPSNTSCHRNVEISQSCPCLQIPAVTEMLKSVSHVHAIKYQLSQKCWNQSVMSMPSNTSCHRNVEISQSCPCLQIPAVTEMLKSVSHVHAFKYQLSQKCWNQSVMSMPSNTSCHRNVEISQSCPCHQIPAVTEMLKSVSHVHAFKYQLSQKCWNQSVMSMPSNTSCHRNVEISQSCPCHQIPAVTEMLKSVSHVHAFKYQLSQKCWNQSINQTQKMHLSISPFWCHCDLRPPKPNWKDKTPGGHHHAKLAKTLF